MAAVAQLSPDRFAWPFKATTGLAPHQFVIARRAALIKELLLESGDLSLTMSAARTGFADSSQLTRHFKRLVGVTPGPFRQR